MDRILLLGVFLCSTVPVFAQGTPTNGCPPICDFTKFDEIRTLASGDLAARLDNVAINFQRQSPAIVLYLIAYAGPRSCLDQANRLNVRAKNYLVAKRGVASRRVILINGGYLDRPMLEVWMLPADVTKPDPMPNIDRSRLRTSTDESQLVDTLLQARERRSLLNLLLSQTIS
jgi:hypothetical protein